MGNIVSKIKGLRMGKKDSVLETLSSFQKLEEPALYYHEYPKPGKLEIQATKPLGNQRDLALAYSPGVAAPCLAIHKDPHAAANYTARSNLVGVISNGSAVLGLGDIGPLAAKPVMEGKAVLFKKFAGIDVFDIEINEHEISKIVETIAALEPTFGGINLEDIKAPECFEIESQLKQRLKIPVFHDDQHGTAIIVAAAVLNGLQLAEKKIEQAKLVASGAGAAALACLNLLVKLGFKKENIWVCDIEGLVYEGRKELMDPWKAIYAQKTDLRTLEDVIADADVFLGLSAGGVLKPELLRKMAPSPLIMALANPIPEVMPEEARKTRPDAMICTGRSDYPNQVNNVLCFPHIFRGALDVGATAINEEMKMAAVRAIADLAHEPSLDTISSSVNGPDANLGFGPDYLIPSPFDSRLILRIAPAVAQAAMDTGVALRPIEDMTAYIDKLNRFVFRSGMIMKPIFAEVKNAERKRVIYADGEDERVLRAAQVVIEEGTAEPILVGRLDVIGKNLKKFGLKIKPNVNFKVIEPHNNPKYDHYVDLLVKKAGRQGVTPGNADLIVRSSETTIAALCVIDNDADAMICGLRGRFERNLQAVEQIIGKHDNVTDFSCMSLLIAQNNILFLSDTYVKDRCTAEEIVEATVLASAEMRTFGIEPKIALLSHSNFGSKNNESAKKMRKAVEILMREYPEIEVDGEMQGDTALSWPLRERIFPHTKLKGDPNLLIFPSLDAANITLNVTKQMTNALHIGPILLGSKYPAHILTPSVTSRGIVNMTAFSVLGANRKISHYM